MSDELENKPKRKVTRKIKKFDFSDENATVSLVGPSVGGGANGWQTLITKSKKNVSEEFLKKASTITVTMDIVEYLQRFFNIWNSEDAELLARSLGFTTPKMDEMALDAQEEAIDSQEPPEKPNYWEMNSDEYEKKMDEYITYKLQSIEVMKSLFESENIEKAVLELSEDDYLKVLQDQELIEKAFAKIDSEKNSTANAGDTSTNVDVEKGEEKSSVVKNKNKGNKPMTKEVQTIEQQVEVIAKAQFDEIQKALEDQKVELQKALDLVKQYETEKKEAIAKSRKEQLEKAAGKHAEVIFKACGELEEELFVEVVKAFADMQEQINKSAAFQELGANVGDVEDQNESPIAKALQARLAKQQKQ